MPPLVPPATAIVAVALAHKDSTAWAEAAKKDKFPPGSPKCNKFVYDVLVEAGVRPPPTVPMHLVFRRPPTAAEWADRKVSIPGWVVVSSPEPGDVAAIARHSESATGHVGIVLGGNLTISATETIIGITPWGFRDGENPTFRRYMGAGKCP